MSTLKKIAAFCIYWTLLISFLSLVAVVIVILTVMAFEKFGQFMWSAAVAVGLVIGIYLLSTLYDWAKENK